MAEQVKKRTTSKWLKRIITAPFVLLAAIIILLEDWLWDDLARLAAAIGRLPVFHQIESLIISLPPYGALILFAVPSALLVPLKLIALYFISHGHAILGFATILGAKIAGTALVARLFILTKPKLLRIRWFAWLYERFVAFKERLYAAIKSTAVYRVAHRQMERMRHAFRAWKAKRKGAWRRRWDAMLKFSRRRKRIQQ
jgi:hypothetical protein